MLTIDAKRYEVALDGQAIHFSPTEFDILKLLKEKNGEVLSREEIAAVIRPAAAKANAYELRVIDQHIARIRRKLKKRRGIVKTVAWRGYKFESRA